MRQTTTWFFRVYFDNSHTEPDDTAAVPGQSRYGALAAKLRGHILRGEWAPASAVPAEAQLARSHGVALGTMRQAIGLLVTEGLLERVHGRGTFVTSGIGGASLMRFFRFGGTVGSGTETTPPVSKILSRRVQRAPADVADTLPTDGSGRALTLTRLRLLGGNPCLHESIWLPLPQCQPLVELPVRQWDDLLYPMLQRLCGTTVHRAEDTVTFVAAPDAVTSALGLAHGASCAKVSRRAYDLAGRCIELRTTYGDAQSFHYTAQLR